MKYRTYIIASFVPLLSALIAGCGDSVLPEEVEIPDVIRIFGEVDLPEEERLRFRIDVGDEGEEHDFNYVGGEGEELIVPEGGDYSISYLDLGDDSVHFGLVSDSRRPLSFSARNSADIYIGTIWPEGERADSSFHWEGGASRRESSSDEKPHTDPNVDLAYPIRYELPAYPDSLIEAGIQGTVRVEVRVGRHGDPLRVTLTRSLNEVLDQLVQDAMMEWDFYPARLGRTYVGTDEFLSVIYEIDEQSRGTVRQRVGF